jgi:hypothetical protein
MNIDEYLAWRKSWLVNTTGTALDSTRGRCIVAHDIVIENNVRPEYHLKNRELEDAEYNLIFNGTDIEPVMKDKLYGDDETLYQAYKQLNISSFKNVKRRDSRNNIIFNKTCCICYWQLAGDRLIVISRSWDIQRAGISDLVIVNRIAHELNCKSFLIHCFNPHAYTNRDRIARRA